MNKCDMNYIEILKNKIIELEADVDDYRRILDDTNHVNEELIERVVDLEDEQEERERFIKRILTENREALDFYATIERENQEMKKEIVRLNKQAAQLEKMYDDAKNGI